MATWKPSWWNQMKPLIELFLSKESQKCLKAMVEGPPFNKWKKCINVDLKESKENANITSDYKSINEFKQRNLSLKDVKVKTC